MLGAEVRQKFTQKFLYFKTVLIFYYMLVRIVKKKTKNKKLKI